MKRADGLYDITRRQLLALAGAAGAGAVLAGCSSDSSGTPDAPVAGPDAGGGACATAATDVGAPATFVTGKVVLVANSKVFVGRDAGGLYAMSSACTHEGATTCVGTTNGCSTSGTDIFCPRHGAVFKFDGSLVRGPASTPLPHFAMCLLANGNVGVQTTMLVAASTRLSA